ncbi:CHRD domain-containing protein [Krasilnikovia cinnamomea]|uniref:CHRD domain-containing protein n=1 Tax=Krasilnikovia cinnamomea TaxID=349313 RepID=A0A4V2G6U9_9ACTN|nr:CHRD domain-containing protein [Krasilnikovia cinnamomea]RZU50036.1 CHRD domain-containing protein [Krasilnikovia cinnamomea]
MKMPVAVSALALTVCGLVLAPAAPPASAAPGAPTTPGTHSMAGMNHAAMPVTAPTSTGSRADGVRRSHERPQYFAATLNGRNEVPVPGGPAVGDYDGQATGLVRVQGNRVTFAFRWKKIGAPTLGHIHQGKAGVNGDVKVPLFTSAMPATVNAAAGVTTVSDSAIADAIRRRPAEFYLNLHTAEFPGGAVRGQLHSLRGSADVLGLLRGGTLKAFLSGDQEVPTPGGPAVGDPTGRAVSFIQPRGNARVDYSFAWVGVRPTLGHIHEGKAGVNGPVVVPLFTTAMPSTIIAVSGTVVGLDSKILRRIKQKPSGFYANLHTAEFPGGAVRGQLFRR